MILLCKTQLWYNAGYASMEIFGDFIDVCFIYSILFNNVTFHHNFTSNYEYFVNEIKMLGQIKLGYTFNTS